MPVPGRPFFPGYSLSDLLFRAGLADDCRRRTATVATYNILSAHPALFLTPLYIPPKCPH